MKDDEKQQIIFVMNSLLAMTWNCFFSLTLIYLILLIEMERKFAEYFSKQKYQLM